MVIFENSIESDTSEQHFYLGISYEGTHLLEMPHRKGYTRNIEDAGVFTSEEASSINGCSEPDGFLRWAVPVEMLNYRI